MLDLKARGRGGRSTTATTCAARWPTTGACARRSTSRVSCPPIIRPLFCRGAGPFRWAALSGDPADIAATDRAVLETFPEERGAGALDPAGAASGSRSRGCPRASAGWSTASGRRWGCGSTGWCKHGKVRGAHRDRARPPRHRLGRLAQPRDRGHARRLGRHRRLAAAQRAAQHRLRRELGVAAPRRRRGHRLLDPRRHGGRGRRHRVGAIGGSSGCSPPIRAPASCGTPTPATSWRSRPRGNGAWTCLRCRIADTRTALGEGRDEAAREHLPARHLPRRGRAGGHPCHPRCRDGLGGGHDPLGRAAAGAAGRVLERRADRRQGGDWWCRAWWTATPTSPSAAGGPTSSPAGSRARATSTSPAAGGGIARTVRPDAGSGRRRAPGPARAGSSREMMALGVTTIEAKSGYGLDREHELRAAAGLPAARAGGAGRGRAHLSGRARGAAGVPRPARGVRRAARRRADPGGGGASGWPRCCDVFVEESAFSVDEARRILLAGRRGGARAQAARRSAERRRGRRAGGGSGRALGRPPGARVGRGDRGDGGGRGGGGEPAHRHVST